MWHSLPHDAREVIEDLRRRYGDRLYDYLRTALLPAEAELALASALVSACVHAGRPVSDEYLRAWLYAVARVHRATAAAARPAGSRVWSRPGPRAALVGQALAGLRADHREVLDLSARHGMTAAEIALILDVEPGQVDLLAAGAADQLHAWVAALSDVGPPSSPNTVGLAGAGRKGGGCEQLAGLIRSQEIASLSELTRTQISRHIADCSICRQAPRSAPTAELLDLLPIGDAPDDLADQFTVAEPLSHDERLWRANGFPAQPERGPSADPLHATPPTPGRAPGEVMAAPGSIAAPAAQPADEHAPSAGQSPPPEDHDPHDEQQDGRQREDEQFRAWDRRSNSVSEFWHKRSDESDPEACLSLRPLLPAIRVAALIIAVVGAVALIGTAWSVLRPDPRPETAARVAAPQPVGTITLITTEQPPEVDPVLQEPPSLAPTQTPTSRPATSRTATKPSTHPTVQMAGTPSARIRPSKTGGPTTPTGPHDPPRQPTTKPSASTTKSQLPQPAAPSARVSPASLNLGSGRTGSVSLDVSPGTGQVVSASGSSGISINGTRITVSAPREKPGCARFTESGTVTLTWSGTSTGDGRITAGTTTGVGTLTVTVTWTVEADQGYWISSGPVYSDRQGHWSNCPNG
ncbi:hypothetical protein [Nonomuraea cavernae]|uniref:Sigma-70 family RNA polymerase sigma factor n=1 Tax=Nonomuraea cavernae TaxID=2045107 RepID=A0A917ZEI0_9ACTN|nr:hypothetical protein [Nonomuraea cavernae]MCA2190613.1 hypothetical protein [Nonomuraea cavernae]GGO81353.1 hypothetical protein GCM10012289_70130 [Nonomuraea cavernae]